MRRIGVLRSHVAGGPARTEPAAAEQRKPLEGIRVVELASVMAAPVAATLLADYGAEVIKIEDPKNPDVTRSWGWGDDPSRTADPDLWQSVEGGGSSFVQLNRGKKSIGLNPMSADGKEVFFKLLATADGACSTPTSSIRGRGVSS